MWQKALQRRLQAKKKVEESKKLTIERLLKKQDAKSKGAKVSFKESTLERGGQGCGRKHRRGESKLRIILRRSKKGSRE